MADLKDPLADLKAELAQEAEADAANDGSKPNGAADPEPEAKDDEPDADETAEGDEAADDEPEGDADEAAAGDEGKPPKKMVPAARAAEEARKRREAQAEAAKDRTRAENAEAELARFKNPAQPKLDADGKPIPKTEEQIREEIRLEERARARYEILGRDFASAGEETYGSDEFTKACNDLSELGADSAFLPLVFEAIDKSKDAAKAVFLLSQQEPDVIRGFFKQSPIRQATFLARLAASRNAKNGAADDDDADDKPSPKKDAKKDVQSSRAPKPISPARGSQTPGTDWSDDMSEEAFSKKFDTEILGKRVN